jgi:Holliday junction resolvasome RuvABC endonuclease subunit
MRILALDPGESTGFAYIEIDNGNLLVQSYGEIPITHPGLHGMLCDIHHWLTDQVSDVVLFEEFIISPRLRTSKESIEARAVIRLFASGWHIGDWAALHPATVRSALGVKNKTEIRRLVESILGFKVRGKDHVTDAIALGMAYAIKQGVWYPTAINTGDFSLSDRTGSAKRKTPAQATDDELREMVKRGEVAVRGR